MEPVVLVHPRGFGYVRGQADITHLANRMAPLGLLSIAGMLRKHGIPVRVFDLCARPLPPDRLVSELMRLRPRLLGLSCTTASFLDGVRTIEAIKRDMPDLKVVFGGVHVSSLKGAILERFPAIDMVVAGEGEPAMLGLAEGKPPSSIPGVFCRDGDGIRTAGPREELVDLDLLPFPAYDLIEGFPRKYLLPIFNYPRFPGATMVTSRGCPYQCSYCDRSVYGRSYRFNSADYVYGQMKYLRRRFGVRHINIYDDQFTFRRSRVKELCDRLAAEPLDLTFNCAVHMGHIDRDLLKALKRAGCWMVSIGIESGDPGLVSFHKQNVQIARVHEHVAMIKQAGLRVKGLFMMGLPGETEETIQRTIRFILSLDLDDMNMSKFTPFPGSPIYRRIHEFGRFEENWDMMNCLNFTFVPEGISSKARLDELYSLFLKSYYQRAKVHRKYIRMMWQSPHSYSVLLRHLPRFVRARNYWDSGAGEKLTV
ncbi:MAG: cobalamin B12-binding domain-containing protein [Deltaproteobacteria bacterium]|nr:cobalamin B12-binding domain-containing protein [Deltaproteobacteria bacterium]